MRKAILTASGAVLCGLVVVGASQLLPGAGAPRMAVRLSCLAERAGGPSARASPMQSFGRRKHCIDTQPSRSIMPSSGWPKNFSVSDLGFPDAPLW